MVKLRLTSLNDSLKVTHLGWACLEAQIEKKEPLQSSPKHRDMDMGGAAFF